MSWITRATELRAQNKSFQEIADALGKHKGRVGQVLGGTKHFRAPWHRQARRMRANGASIEQIVELSGKGYSTVVGVVKDVYCPINHRKPSAQKREFRPIDHSLTSEHLSEIDASLKAHEEESRRKYLEKLQLRDDGKAARRKQRLEQILAKKKWAQDKAAVDRLLRLVAERHEISVEELTGKGRQAHIIRARWDAIIRLRHDFRKSLSEIGRILGQSDHTSALHALRETGLDAPPGEADQKRLREFKRNAKESKSRVRPE